MALTEYEKNTLERLKLIKKQPEDRHIDIYLGKNYLDNLLVEYKDKSIIEKNNKNEIIDLLLDTAIKYLENKANEEDLEHK